MYLIPILNITELKSVLIPRCSFLCFPVTTVLVFIWCSIRLSFMNTLGTLSTFPPHKQKMWKQVIRLLHPKEAEHKVLLYMYPIVFQLRTKGGSL